jgi:hypothetical protein
MIRETNDVICTPVYPSTHSVEQLKINRHKKKFSTMNIFGLWPLAFGLWPVLNTTETTPDPVFEELLIQDKLEVERGLNNFNGTHFNGTHFNTANWGEKGSLEIWLQVERVLWTIERKLYFKRRIVARKIRESKYGRNKSEHHKWLLLERGLKDTASKLDIKRRLVQKKIRKLRDGRK